MTDVVIIGAGPYGLSLAAHLSAQGVDHRIFGPPMDTWLSHVPAGMLLKSDPFASNLSEPSGRGTLEQFCAGNGLPYHRTDLPVPVATFNAYAQDFQRRYVPEVDQRCVSTVERSGSGFAIGLDDGESFSAERIVCAVGISHFAVVPDLLEHLPADLMTHSSVHHRTDTFSGKEVAIIGRGSSAVDLGTLMAESGADVTMITRGSYVSFSSEPVPSSHPRFTSLRSPSSGLGPGWRSWICENWPGAFRYLPGELRQTIVRRHLGPRAAHTMKARFDSSVKIRFGQEIERVEELNGRVRLTLRDASGSTNDLVVDHVVAATGYRAGVDRLDFLDSSLQQSIKTHHRMPVLSRSFESSVPGLFFVGPVAVDTFGPLMRFMVGAEYAAPKLARALARSRTTTSTPALSASR